MDTETRRAHGAYRLEIDGQPPLAGEGDVEVTDAGVAAGGVLVDFLDADAFRDAGRTLTLELHPPGRLTISLLGRRHETFAKALGEARDAGRLAGLLAHGVAAPRVFAGAVKAPGPPGDARLLVYATHLAVAPADGDPYQVPYGSVRRVSFEDSAWEVVLETGPSRHVFGRLGRETDPFFRAVSAARDTQALRLAEAAGSPLFADGTGVEARALPDFDRLLEAFCAPERLDGARAILERADRASSRLGLVELLDPDDAGLAARRPLPPNVATFLLAPLSGGRVVLELLSGPSAATYVFRGDAASVNDDLRALHFRRRALSLSESEAAGEAGRVYRLALRKLEPLKRLRAAVADRLVHDESWRARFDAVL